MELNKADIQWLWEELRRLFDPPPPGRETKDVQGTISAPTLGENLEDSDVGSFLGSGLLGDRLDGLSIHMFGTYREPRKEFESLNDSRRLHLHLSAIGDNNVTLSGEKEWILRVRAFFDTYFETRKREVRGLRWGAGAVLSFAPGAALYSIGGRLDNRVLTAAALLWPVFGFGLSLFKIDTLFPHNLIVIDERGLRNPWYVALGRELLLGVLVAAATAVMFALVWPF